jgi:hypothetical protein
VRWRRRRPRWLERPSTVTQKDHHYIKTHFPLLQDVDGKVCMLAAQLQQGFNQKGGVPIDVNTIMSELADGLATLAYRKLSKRSLFMKVIAN